MPPDITVFKCKFINFTYLSNLETISEEKWKNIFFLYKSIGFVPKIEIMNISASICPICMIWSSLDSSQLVLVKLCEKMVISVTNQLFLLSMS